jgi:O-antigen/teichoic acid export membrane protein
MSGKYVEKAFQMGKTSAMGSFQLFIGVAVSTTIMAVGTIILGNLLHEDGYGLYTITLTPALMIGLFRDWGVNSAMTKYIASLRLENKDSEIRDIIVAGLAFEVIVGLVLTLVSLFLANFIGTEIYHRPESVPLISIISITIFGGSLLNAAQSSFIGFERMGLNSFTLICQAIVKTAVGPILVILGYSAIGASVGYTAASLFAGLIGITTLYFAVFRKLGKMEKRSGLLERLGGLSDTLKKNLKRMLKYGVPLSISTILAGILAQTYGLAMAFSVSDNAILGNYSTASNFAVLLTFLSIPISTVLFPTFARLDPENERELISSIFASSVKYTALVLVPATMAMMILSKPMISTLYGEASFITAPFFLTLLVITNLLVVFGSLSLGSFLSGVGETRKAMILGIVTMAFGLPLGLILIPRYGILGVIVGNMISGIPSTLWGLHWVWKHYEAKAEFRSSVKIFTASMLAAMVSYPTTLLHSVSWVQLVLGLTVFLVIYLFGAPLIGALGQSEIDTLRNMFSGLGIVSKIINIPLKAAERTAQIKTSNKKRRNK